MIALAKYLWTTRHQPWFVRGVDLTNQCYGIKPTSNWWANFWYCAEKKS